MDPKPKAFIVHVATLSVNLDDELHLSRRAQIAYQKADKASSKVLSEYADFADVFSLKLAAKLPKHMRINNHAIELVDD